MAVYLGNKKVGVTIEKEKPDMLQARIDETNSCNHLFFEYKGNSLDFAKDLDTSNVTTMEYMFYACKNVEELDKISLNTENVTTFRNMFYNCYKLKTIPQISNTSNVKTFEYMFDGCEYLETLDLSHFDTSKSNKMQYMFDKCKKLTQLDLSHFDTSNVDDMQYMFSYCKELVNLDLSSFDTRKVTKMNYMFYQSDKLETISGIDMISLTTAPNAMLGYTKGLKNLYLKNIRLTLQIGNGDTGYGTLLTDDSIINTFKELWDLTGGTSQKLTLSTPSNARTEQIYVKLVDVTDEMRAEDEYIDNKKPCVVCESTDEGAMTLKEYGISKNWQIA